MEYILPAILVLYAAIAVIRPAWLWMVFRDASKEASAYWRASAVAACAFAFLIYGAEVGLVSDPVRNAGLPILAATWAVCYLLDRALSASAEKEDPGELPPIDRRTRNRLKRERRHARR